MGLGFASRTVTGCTLTRSSRDWRANEAVRRPKKGVGCSPEARVESESILHLMFQTQFTDLCTIIPSHFAHAPGLHHGTLALPLVDPIVSQDVGLFWAEGEIVLPMANAFVSIVQELNKSGKLRKSLAGDKVDYEPEMATKKLKRA